VKHNVVYQGIRDARGCRAGCNGVSLSPRTDLRNHSSTGFEWGVIGNGAQQLALAILCDFYGDDAKALDFYEDFKTDILVPIGQASWTIKSEVIVEWTRKKMKEYRHAAKQHMF